MNAECKIRELVQATLVDNHHVDGVGFIDQLFPIVSGVGAVCCTLAGEGRIRFRLAQEPAWEVELGRAKTKLRMLCARLGVICQEQNGRFVSLYGDEADVELPTALPAGRRWHVRFKNTPSEQEFTIAAVKGEPLTNFTTAS
jgi:hypothetical protein